MFRVAAIKPVGDPWLNCRVGGTNSLYYSKLSELRGTDAYLDVLHVFVDEYDQQRKRSKSQDFQALWDVDGTVHTVTCVRGELMLTAIERIQRLLATDDVKDHALAARLALWVVLPQQELWFLKGHAPAPCRLGNEVLALCLVRLQGDMISQWEAAGKNPVHLACWGAWIAERLQRKLPHFAPVATEMRALCFRHAIAKSPADQNALHKEANRLFLSIGRRERVLTSMAGASPDANAVFAALKLRPVCATQHFQALAEDYVPARRGHWRKMWRQ